MQDHSKQLDAIKRLMDEVRTLEASPENKARRDKWNCVPYTARDQWRGLPKNDGSCHQGVVPIQVDPNNTFWADYLGFKIGAYFNDAYTFAENYLKMTIERFKLFDDDVYIAKRFPIWGGAPFEGSMYGMDIKFFDEVDPWMDFTKLVLPDHESLDRMQMLDFRNCGMMPSMIALYETLSEIADDDFDVLFPEYLRGPFGIATYLRGFENVLIDMVDDEEFVHKFMRYIVDSRKKWYKDLEAYLGRPVAKANLFNDEVNIPSLSVNFFREFVLPYEKELSEFHGGLHYYHSCGNLSLFYPYIAEIPNIDMIHKGPWSSAQAAAEAMGKTVPIEIVLDPQKDICDGNEQSMRALMGDFVRTMKQNEVCGYTLRANNIQKFGTLDNSIEKARSFVRAARNAVDEES